MATKEQLENRVEVLTKMLYAYQAGVKYMEDLSEYREKDAKTVVNKGCSIITNRLKEITKNDESNTK